MSKTNVKKTLEHFEIDFVEEYEQVSDKCYGVQCPYCDDKKYHCGVFKDTGYFSCFRCGETGNLFKLINQFQSIDWETFKFIAFEEEDNVEAIDRIKEMFNNKTENKEKNMEKIEVDLPKFTVPISEACRKPILYNVEPLINFILKRKINHNKLLNESCLWCYYGEFAGRLIIPIKENNKLIGYQARDITNRSKNKYVFSAGFKASEYLYNLKNQKLIYLVEGILDCWRVGDNAVSSFSSHLSKKQINLLANSKVQKIVLMWDGDAYDKALKMAKEIAPLFEKVGVVQLPVGTDPDSLGKNKLKKYLENINWI